MFLMENPHPPTKKTNPLTLNIYGVSKLAGEKAVTQTGVPHMILRTSGVYGLRGTNFLLTMQKLAQTRDQLTVVDDQIGAPTWSRAIAEGTARILKKCPADNSFPHSGIFNMSCGGETSWFGFAKHILELSGLIKNTELIAIPSIEYPTPALRPKNSLLSNEKLKQTFHHELPHWLVALKECLSNDTKDVSS